MKDFHELSLELLRKGEAITWETADGKQMSRKLATDAPALSMVEQAIFYFYWDEGSYKEIGFSE